MSIDADSKTVFLFQGIGCNLDKLLPGLGEEELSILADLCMEASEYAEIDLLKYLNYRKDNKEITDIFAEWLTASLTDIAVFKTLINKGIKPDYIIGYSLGLNNAMHCAGSISLKACVDILKSGIDCREEVKTRSKVEFDMGTVIGLEKDVIEELIKSYSSFEKVQIASQNTKIMIILSGEKNEVQTVLDKALEEGAIKAFRLGVGTPFHTSMMSEYSSCYFNVLKKVRFIDSQYPVVSIYSQKIITSAEEMYNEQRRNYLEQMKWKTTIEYLESIGVRDFYDMSAAETNKKASSLKNKDSRFITIKKIKTIGGH